MRNPENSHRDLTTLFDNQSSITSDQWMNSAEAAQYLRISEKTLMNNCSCGRIPYYKLGRSNRYLKSELDRLLLSNKRGGNYGN